MLISKLIGRKAYNISTAIYLGEILYPTYADGVINNLITDMGYAFRTKDIIANNNVITCNTHCPESELKHKPFPYTNVDILTTQGKTIGKLVDVMINKDYKVTKLISDQKSTMQFNIKSYSENAIVLHSPAKKVKEVKQIDTTIPTVIANYEFLIGRTLYKNILSRNGKLQFASGRVITQSDIDKARNLGKLVQLTLYSKQM